MLLVWLGFPQLPYCPYCYQVDWIVVLCLTSLITDLYHVNVLYTYFVLSSIWFDLAIIYEYYLQVFLEASYFASVISCLTHLGEMSVPSLLLALVCALFCL